MSNTKQHIGDGVYVDSDGYHLVLTTEDGVNTPENTIFIDPYVATALKAVLEKFLERRIPE